jgi:hypothetical protein
VSGHLCVKCSCNLVSRHGDLVRVASKRSQGLGRAGCVSAVKKGGPRARRKSLEVGCPWPRLGSGEAWSSHSCGLIPDLIVPIRPLQLYADGGYQLRIRRLEGTPNYGPRQLSSLRMFTRRKKFFKFFAFEMQRIIFTTSHIHHLMVHINRRKINYKKKQIIKG